MVVYVFNIVNAKKFLYNWTHKPFEITITNVCIQEKTAIFIHKWSKKVEIYARNHGFLKNSKTLHTKNVYLVWELLT